MCAAEIVLSKLVFVISLQPKQAFGKMRYRNGNYQPKIFLIFVACVLFYFLWCLTRPSGDVYPDGLPHSTLKEFSAKQQEHLRQVRIRQNGEFWILENYIVASKQFGYLESMTYTTHGEYMFLDNLEAIVERWRAPVSIAIFAPSDDFNRTLRSIGYLRSCTTEKNLIRDLVTFHIYFPSNHMPSFIPKTEMDFKIFDGNCTQEPPFLAEANDSYRHDQDMLYPINVGRNIARRLARTHYLLPSDIEMYPNWNFVKEFLSMIHRDPDLLLAERQVYPLAVFEVDKHQDIPNSKTDLQVMLSRATAIPFHMKICMYCHAIPKLNEWMLARETESLEIFLTVKHHSYWEPFYVTTNSEPFFDERYTWEGRYDKQIQADLLGIMNYDFSILNNAFLVHRPGIKTVTRNTHPEIKKMSMKTVNEVKPQMKTLYG